MKIVIDIPEEAYKKIRGYSLHHIDFCYTEDVALLAIKNGTPLPQCKDCKHFETDVVATCDGIPLIIGHECCTKWGDGCKTREDGYCFMFEEKEADDVRKSD
jgi:hypothetical protein